MKCTECEGMGRIEWQGSTKSGWSTCGECRGTGTAAESKAVELTDLWGNKHEREVKG